MTVPTSALWDAVNRELATRGLSRSDLWRILAEHYGGQPNSYEKRAYRWDHEHGGQAPLDRADQILVALGLHLSDLDIDEQPAPRKRGGGKPVGVYGYLTDTQLRALHRAYEQGMSLRAIAQQIHPRTRYATVKSCAMGIQQGFARLGLERRDRATATRLASTIHGLASRGNVDPEHRRRLKIARGEIMNRPRCAGRSIRSGKQCRCRAMAGSNYCHAHDPARRAQVVSQTAAMRARKAAA